MGGEEEGRSSMWPDNEEAMRAGISIQLWPASPTVAGETPRSSAPTSSYPPSASSLLQGCIHGDQDIGATSRQPSEARSTSTTETLAGEIEGATTGGEEK